MEMEFFGFRQNSAAHRLGKRQSAWVLAIYLTVLQPCYAAETCRFQRLGSSVGDVARQSIQCDLGLTVAMRQNDQVIDSAEHRVQRILNRSIKILKVSGTAPAKAQVTYESASLTIKQAQGDPQETKQPIAGKTYIVTRSGDTLTITDPEGHVPPPEEMQILLTNLETFGRPNPIADFFAGRTLSVGQSLELPASMARDLLGIPDAIGNVSQLTMKLVAVRDMQARRAAEFQVELSAETPQPQGMRMKLSGKITLDVNTSRTLAVRLAGPVSVEEEHGPRDGRFSVVSQGDLRVAMRNDYGQSAR